MFATAHRYETTSPTTSPTTSTGYVRFAARGPQSTTPSSSCVEAVRFVIVERGVPPLRTTQLGGTVANKPAIHTLPREAGGWTNKREGSTRALGNFARKTEAQSAGRQTAKRDKTEHIIHTRDGRIASRNSYGNDPASRKG
jgi:ketosteroid isomerase-like protein